MSNLPAAKTVNLQPPDALNDWYFYKGPITVAQRHTLRLVVSSPSDIHLAFVPAKFWTGNAGPVDLDEWVANETDFTGRPSRKGSWFGGLLIKESGGCLDLHSATHDATTTVRLSYDAALCNG
ncbi:hypothetical protein [Spelaeicoccus albus]|uniref:Uncharacterized protein n=1 Tax=Spelaeicoccus albus TaxID=1280376 RepID=A0A7Z0AAE2_9MICO|nr:hypothetical protein [Spelaeicoccus albus]NYI66290.1 hypothetical protein [Spelaeicoccus albus]